MAANVPLPIGLSNQVLSALPRLRAFEQQNRVLPVPAIESALPDGGLPKGAVAEFACPQILGQATSLALRACAAAQNEARLRGGDPAWCAWLDPARTLYAPGVAAHGVVLDRLLVVQPPPEALARIAVRLVASRVFAVVIVDTLGVPGCCVDIPLHRWPNVVRRLAIAAREGDTSVILLTEHSKARAISLPVAMRVELRQPDVEQLTLRIAKERRGRIAMPRNLAYTRPARERQRRSA